jgi:hypothetical protein
MNASTGEKAGCPNFGRRAKEQSPSPVDFAGSDEDARAPRCQASGHEIEQRNTVSKHAFVSRRRSA